MIEIFSRIHAFRRNERGALGILFVVVSMAVMTAMAGAFDVTRAYLTRQKLSQTAVLACQYATRPGVVSTSVVSGASAYVSQVDGFITATLSSQGVGSTQTTSQPFSYTSGGSASVTLTTDVPTTFAKILNLSQIPVGATSYCFDSIATINGPVSPAPVTVTEAFTVTGCTGTGTCGWFYSAPGSNVSTSWGTTRSTATTTSSSTIGYTGGTGLKWVVLGYCLEVDTALFTDPIPAGSNLHSAELDCDNGSNGVGNSSISTKQTLSIGNYELRYYYNSRVNYPNYNPTYICGSSANDVSWASDTNSGAASPSGNMLSNKLKTNQINVYLDKDATGTPPLHQTLDGTQNLGGSNLIDVCVYAGQYNWIERSVRIYVATAGDYWLSFAADGASDTFGGAIADIRLCQGTCSGSVQDNFPSPWQTSTNLFEDTFESPSYTYSTTGTSAYLNTSGNMTSSKGTSGSSGGWPNQTASGWASAATNQLNYVMKSPTQGLQAIELAGSGTTARRLIGRGFLLDPGYYKLTYYYISDGKFSSLTTAYCGATPSAANIPLLLALQPPTPSATSRATGSSTSVDVSSNFIGVFMSHALKASTPVVGGALGSTTSYNNPNGTTTTTPTAAPDAISLTNYDAS
jgi:Flp pilus assembly protein TadG